MNIYSRILLIISGWLFSFAQIEPAPAAVTLSITPSAVSNTYSGSITLQISSLTNGERVVVQKFLDLNANGIIESNDLLVQQFTLTDGQAGMVIGGVTNFNVPGDTDGAANGQITATMDFRNWDSMQNIIGDYLYKLSSPVGHFAALTNQLLVTNFPFLQKITGNVFSNGTSVIVPNAIILLFQSGETQPLVGATVANNAGSYSLQMPPGTYVPWVLSSNYVFNSLASPILALAGSESITCNLTLTNATASISGQVVDAGDTSIGLPGVVQGAKSDDGQVAFAFSDTNGYFSMRVTSGQWDLGGLDWGLIVHGYVGADTGSEVDAGTTGLLVTCPRATALFYGNVDDNFGNPMPGIDVRAYDYGGAYQIDGYTDANGNYFIGVPGSPSDGWYVEIKTETNPTDYDYSQQTISGNINTNQALLQNFTSLLATNQITGWLKDQNGNPIPGVSVIANTSINGLYYQSAYEVYSDARGNYELNVGNGTWVVGFDYPGFSGAYITPANQTVVISNSNAIVNFIADRILMFTNQNGIFLYTTNNGTVSIYGYQGSSSALTIPGTITGMPVTSINANLTVAFDVYTNYNSGFTNLNSVIVPNSVTNIGDGAFSACSRLVSIYFASNAPSADSTVFGGDYNLTVYYRPCCGGWTSHFAGLTTVDLNWIAFSPDSTYGAVPLTVLFTSPGADSCSNTISRWYWTFGDGSTSFAPNPAHTYTTAGTFYPALMATNNIGDVLIGEGPASITVTNATVIFGANTTNGAVPLTVDFNSRNIDSSGNAIKGWYWTFGDGSTSVAQNPSHIYTTAGTFYPVLIATNNLGGLVYGLGPSIITSTNVPEYLGLVLNGGFETGDFTGWTFAGDTTTNGGFYNGVVDSNYVTSAGVSYVHSGNYGAALGQYGYLATLSQSLSTVSGQRYLLSFWLENPTNDHTQIFMVNWNTNNFTETVYAVTNPPAFAWSNFTFVVTANSTATVLQFAVENDPDFFGLDDISVSPAQLNVANFELSGTNLVLNVINGKSGGTYHVLMSTNLVLALGQWTPMTTNMLNTNGNFAITVTNAINRNSRQRFFILQQQ